MVAVQTVEYSREGKILPPRPELLRFSRDPNGKFSCQSNHWHRHTIAAQHKAGFEQALAALKKDLERVGAEVIDLQHSSATVLDLVYLVEDRARTEKIRREIGRGVFPPELTTSDLRAKL